MPRGPGRFQAKLLRAAFAELPSLPQAACRDRPDLTWYPKDEDGPQARAAVNVCCGCPHVAACAAWAIANPSVEGVWGGLTTSQRRTLHDARRPDLVGERWAPMPLPE